MMVVIGEINMSLINDKIIKELSKWAEINANNHIFPKASYTDASYYLSRDSEETYMMEYSFKTEEEIKNALERYCGLESEPQLLKELTIAICQNRYKARLGEDLIETDANQETKSEDSEAKLPEYIYVF